MKYILIGIILVAALAYLIDTFIRWLHYRKEKRRTKSVVFEASLLQSTNQAIMNQMSAYEAQKELLCRRPSTTPTVHDDTLDAMRYAALWSQESPTQSPSMDYYLGVEAAPSPDFGGFGGGDFSGGGASGDWGSSDTGSADAGGSFGND